MLSKCCCALLQMLLFETQNAVLLYQKCHANVIYLYTYITTELDGTQQLVFYHVDLLDEMKRLLAMPSFLNQQYFAFERQESLLQPGQRVFGKINGGLWFEQMSSKYPEARIAGIVLNSDGSFFGVHKQGHPIYGRLKIK